MNLFADTACADAITLHIWSCNGVTIVGQTLWETSIVALKL